MDSNIIRWNMLDHEEAKQGLGDEKFQVSLDNSLPVNADIVLEYVLKRRFLSKVKRISKDVRIKPGPKQHRAALALLEGNQEVRYEEIDRHLCKPGN